MLFVKFILNIENLCLGLISVGLRHKSLHKSVTYGEYVWQFGR